MEVRIIGIRHRIKRTAEGEARPTQVCIFQQEDIVKYDLADETDELDWVLGHFPTAWESIKRQEDLSSSFPHHILRRKLKKEENPKSFPDFLLSQEGKDWWVATKVLNQYDGLKPSDKVGMVLGGSGDRLAYASSRQAEGIGAEIYRIPPATPKDRRAGRDKKEDSQTLAELLRDSPGLFYPVTVRDRELIFLREAYLARTEAMKARVACEQRLRQHLIGQIFCQPDGLYPEGRIESLYDEAKASNIILNALVKEEKAREKELTKAVESLDVYQKLFVPIEGVGPMIASRLIVAIGDIRRFPTDAKLKAFCGVHLLKDGRFPRKRSGEVANWHNDARQALFLLGDQFNRRPGSEWGKKLIDYKRKFREKYPEVEVVNGKKRYTNAHIHKMAIWRTLTKFTEWLWRAWWALEKKQ